MKTSWRGTLLRMGISLIAVFLILFFLRDKLSESFQIIRKEVIPSWFILILATYFVANILLAIRLRYVFQVQHVRMTIREAIHLIFIGVFFNLFLPSAVGGDVAKAYYAYQFSGKKMQSMTSVLLDRLLGFVTLILMALAGILVSRDQFQDPRIQSTIYVFMALMVFMVAFLWSKRFARRFKFMIHWLPSENLRGRLAEVYHAIYGYKHHSGILVLTLALSFLGQVLFIWAYYCTARSLGQVIDPWLYFILVPLISVISMAPSMGGLGVREAGSIYLFGRFMTMEHALAVSLLMDIVIYGFSLASGVWYAIHGGLKAKVIHEMEEIAHVPTSAARK